MTVGLGEMQDHLCQVVALHGRSEFGDPFGDHTPGFRCRGGGLHLRVSVRAHAVIITRWHRCRHASATSSTIAPGGVAWITPLAILSASHSLPSTPRIR